MKIAIHDLVVIIIVIYNIITAQDNWQPTPERKFKEMAAHKALTIGLLIKPPNEDFLQERLQEMESSLAIEPDYSSNLSQVTEHGELINH